MNNKILKYDSNSLEHYIKSCFQCAVTIRIHKLFFVDQMVTVKSSFISLKHMSKVLFRDR